MEDKKNTGMGIDDTLNRINDIIYRMENENQTLEDTFQDYETGMQLIRECQSQMSLMEQKIEIIKNTESSGAKHDENL